VSISISVLDQSPIYPGETAAKAFEHTIELARQAEALGFRRFWVSEHHDSEQVAGSSPEVLISHLLAKTERIRIGSGGIMLQHYSPYKVAENFNVLASLAPGRVDLGVGRAPGGLPRSTQALQQDIATPRTLTDKLVELEAYVHNRLPEEHPLHGIRISPTPPEAPELYVLGASLDSAKIAASLGLPYVFSIAINGEKSAAVEALRAYRSLFNGSLGRTPEAFVALSVVVAETDEEARELVGEQKLFKIHLANGRKLTVATLEQAEEFGRQSSEPYTIEEKLPEVTKGSKETVREELLALWEQTGVSELMVTTKIPDLAGRLRSFKLLREALDGVVTDA
jgi:luciferase family oxidoreductase group 1